MADLHALVSKRIARGSDMVISMSGGKDSTATYLHLLETGVLDQVVSAGGQVRRVFADTGWELPETYAYLDDLAARFGPIDRVATWVPGPGEAPPSGYHTLVPQWTTPRGGEGGAMHADRWAMARVIEARLGRYSPLVRLMLEWRKVPLPARRWCTQDTKKKPIVAYLAGCEDPINVIGVRAEESAKRAKMPEVEWSDEYDALVWRPIFAFTKADVIAIHTRHGIEPNPLYLQGQGAGRVGCGPCVYSTRADLRWLATEHAGRLAILSEIEQAIADLGPPGGRAMGGDAPRWFVVRDGQTVISLTVPEAVARAQQHGPEQEPERGCAEWGLCQT